MDYHRARLSLPSVQENAETRQYWRKQSQDRALRAATIAGDSDFVDRTTAAIVQCAAELRESAFWKSMQEALAAAVSGTCQTNNTNSSGVPRPPQELVCYGLGKLDNAFGAYQLGLLTLLAKELELEPDRVFGFDPIFTPQEREVLVRCGCTALDVDEQARRRATVPTLYYMPHCPFSLYNNLVHANWAAPWNVMLIGNDVRFHALHNAPFTTVAPQLAKALHVMEHTRLPDTFISPNPATELATSMQLFSLGSLYKFAPKETWDAALAEGGAAGDWRGLGRWVRDGPGELPMAKNLRERLAAELRDVEARAAFLRRELHGPLLSCAGQRVGRGGSMHRNVRRAAG